MVTEHYPTLCLHLIVRNESHILARCLESVKPYVREIYIADTGSTDATVELLTSMGCHVTTDIPFTNFGETRTRALQWAQLHTTCDYILLLDADMILQVHESEIFSHLKHDAYSITQYQGDVAYTNIRLIRRNLHAEYIGSTHEYLRINATHDTIPPKVISIDDTNCDGSNRRNKLERDKKLLTDDLAKSPNDSRSLFYLGQTYFEMGDFSQALTSYLECIRVTSWDEERAYSHYRVAVCYIALANPTLAEVHVRLSQRPEAYLSLVQMYLDVYKHPEAFYWNLQGRALKREYTLFQDVTVSLKRDYFDTIMWFYISNDRAYGRILSLRFLSRPKNPFIQTVYNNMVHYTEEIAGIVIESVITSLLDDPNFYPSTPSWSQNIRVIRHVNYRITSQGKYTYDPPVTTRNVLIDGDGVPGELILQSSLVACPSSLIKGLEDLRLCHDDLGKLWFLGTSLEYSSVIRQVYGTIEGHTATIRNILPSPRNTIEKNWVFVTPALIVYCWDPITLYTFPDMTLLRTLSSTPIICAMRGSSNAVHWNGDWWFVTHSVGERAGRRYYLHYFVVLDNELTRVERVSVPFFIGRSSPGIEFCLGFSLDAKGALLGYSIDDSSAYTKRIPWNVLYSCFDNHE